MSEAARQAVDAGFAFLMEYEPSGDWIDRIDLETLRIESLDNCVISQAYGGYESGLARLKPELAGDWTGSPAHDIPYSLPAWAGLHGFAFISERQVTREELNRAWHEKIAAAKAQR